MQAPPLRCTRRAQPAVGLLRARCSKRAPECNLGAMQAVTCTLEKRDRYNRGLGLCSLVGAPGGANSSLNAWMVEQGLAVAYRWGLRLWGLLQVGRWAEV